MEREFGFTRDVRPNGIAGWRVRLRRNGKQVANRFFTDTTYGGEDQALEAARKYRNEVAAEHGIATSKAMNTELFMVRQKLGLTQAEAAALLGVAPLTFSRWEGSMKDAPNLMHKLLEFVATKQPKLELIQQEELADLRSRLGLNKTEMGELIDVRYDTYGRWEAMKTKPDAWAMVFFSAINSGWKPGTPTPSDNQSQLH